MNKFEVVKYILQDKLELKDFNENAKVFAPTNIALCKYWGKRNQELNLPETSSLSISLDSLGAKTNIKVNKLAQDNIILNGDLVAKDSEFSKKLLAYLNLFRQQKNIYFDFEIESNIPIAAGLASSACGFASIVKSLNALFNWNLSSTQLSILARLGSGSASRSIYNGFVEWHKGLRDDGMDSFAEPLDIKWPQLKIGLLMLSKAKKSISSRVAMQQTVETSMLYKAWPSQVTRDLELIKSAIFTKNFELLGKTVENNALAMHATMLAAKPAISYCLPETLVQMQKIWALRDAGLDIYFTQDAGPNLKLLYLERDKEKVVSEFNTLAVNC